MNIYIYKFCKFFFFVLKKLNRFLLFCLLLGIFLMVLLLLDCSYLIIDINALIIIVILTLCFWLLGSNVSLLTEFMISFILLPFFIVRISVASICAHLGKSDYFLFWIGCPRLPMMLVIFHLEYLNHILIIVVFTFYVKFLYIFKQVLCTYFYHSDTWRHIPGNVTCMSVVHIPSFMWHYFNTLFLDNSPWFICKIWLVCGSGPLIHITYSLDY